MIQVKIDVAGPGLVIANETYLIKHILEKHGYNVEVRDSHPPTKEFDPENIDGTGVKVIIETHHAPWGG
jgi:hypothetical protein